MNGEKTPWSRRVRTFQGHDKDPRFSQNHFTSHLSQSFKIRCMICWTCFLSYISNCSMFCFASFPNGVNLKILFGLILHGNNEKRKPQKDFQYHFTEFLHLTSSLTRQPRTWWESLHTIILSVSAQHLSRNGKIIKVYVLCSK